MAIVAERSKTILKKTERDLRSLREGYQPEVVHSFRTTTRRLEVLLEQLNPAHDRNQKKLLKNLRRIRKRAGRIRDIDVQLAALRSLKVPLEPRRKTQLAQRLLDLRRKQEKKLGKDLNKRDFAVIAKRLKKLSRSLSIDSAIDPLQVARQTLAAASKGEARIDEDRLHTYRLAVKRARYAAEFAPKSAESMEFIAQLKTLQDALGHWHDWFTLTQTASQHLGDIHQSPLMAALHNVTRGKYRDAVAKLSTVLEVRGSLALVPARAQVAKTPAAQAARAGTAA